MANVSDVLFCLLFADDSNIFLSGKNLNDLVDVMNNEMKNIVEWLQVNKLTLNVKKTHFMIFRRNRNRILLNKELLINGEPISMVETTKFLGIQIDSCLTWRNHIQCVSGKASRGLGIIYKARKYLDQASLVTLYYSFIYPYLTYCIESWGNTFDSYLSPLIKLQKRAIRTITNSPKRSHTAPLFKDLNMLDIRQLYIFSVQLFMQKFHQNKIPNIFGDFYTPNIAVHSHNTRQSRLLHTPMSRTSHASRFIRYTGVKVYNYFYNILNRQCSIGSYKKSLKQYLSSNQVQIL